MSGAARQSLEIQRAQAYVELAQAQHAFTHGRGTEAEVRRKWYAHETLARKVGNRESEGFSVRRFSSCR